jgi:hypothetical protein
LVSSKTKLIFLSRENKIQKKMPPKKSPAKSPKRPPCQGNDVQYKRGNKKFCRSPAKKGSPPKAQRAKPKPKTPPKPKAKSPPKQNIPEKKTRAPPIEFPVSGTNRQACMRQYIKQPDVSLGQGMHGMIMPVCEDKTCKYVLKISDEIANAERDVYFLKLLQNKKVNREPIVPKLYDFWLCSFPFVDPNILTQHSFILLDRWDSDMQKLAYARMSKPTNRPVYRKSEIIRMFCLAYVLGLLGIIHGDLKADQYLQRGDGKLIVITDFGMAGGEKTPYVAELGWSGQDQNDANPQVYSCGVWFTKLEYDSAKNQADFPIFMNLIQLEMSLVWTQAVVDIGGGKLRHFGGIKHFYRKYTNKFCTKWSQFLDAENEKSKDPFYILMDDIINCAADG